MFVQSAKFVESHSGNINDISVYGQDSNPTTWKMAQMNLAIRGIDADLGKFNADTFFNDCHPTLRADFIMANPPFNLSDWGRRQAGGRCAVGIWHATGRKCKLCPASAHDSSLGRERAYRHGAGERLAVLAVGRGG